MGDATSGWESPRFAPLALGLAADGATAATFALALALLLAAAGRRKARADLGGQDVKLKGPPFKVLFWDRSKNEGPTLHDLPSKQLQLPLGQICKTNGKTLGTSNPQPLILVEVKTNFSLRQTWL